MAKNTGLIMKILEQFKLHCSKVEIRSTIRANLLRELNRCIIHWSQKGNSISNDAHQIKICFEVTEIINKA